MIAPTTPKTRARRAAPSRGVRALHVGVLLMVLMAVSGTAWAGWTATGGGAGRATTDTLVAPSGVTGTAASGGTSVAVAWNSPSTGVSPAGYRVDRTDTTSGTTVAACGSSASTPVTGTSCTDSSVPDGVYRYTVVAIRSGWTATSTPSGPVTVQAAVPTTVTLTSSASPSVVGQSVTITATVSAASGAATGSVVFRDGGTPIACTGGVQTISSGRATCSTSWASAGTRSITAAYAGSAPYAPSTSAAVSQVVDGASTTTSVVSSTSPSVVGQSVTYTATVSATAPGGGTPSGAVTFKDGASTLTCAGGTQILASGTATCVVVHGSVGTRSIIAAYAGSANHLPSTSSALTQVVNAASTTTSLTTSATTVATGQSVTFTATVAPVAPGGGVPTGAVTFKDGTTALSCAGGSPTLNGSGVATCTTSFTPAGSRAITATYAGSSSYLSSTSAPVAQGVVNAAAVGLGFSAVTVDGVGVTPTCTGSASSGYSCTLPGGNNAVLSASVGFVDTAGAPISYSSSTETISWTSTGKTAGSGTVTVSPNATTATGKVGATKTGTNPASVTLTFTTAGGATWTATLTVT